MQMEMTRQYRSVREGQAATDRLGREGWRLVASREVPRKAKWQLRLILPGWMARRTAGVDYICTFSNDQ